MAVRFNADAEDFTRAIGLGTVTAYTVTTWLFVAVDRNTWSTAWSLDNGTGDVDVLQTGSDGTGFGFYSDGNNPAVLSATVGIWYFVGISRSGSGGTAYVRAEGAGSLTTVSLAGSSASTNMATLRLGESPWGGEWLNGRLAAWKVWNGVALTQTEIEAEAATYDVLRATNIYAAYFRDSVTLSQDYSGNGNHLSGGAATSVEDGPAELAGGGGIEEPYGHISETESSRTLTSSKTTNVAAVVETEVSRLLSASKTTSLAMAAETETVRSFTASKTITLARAVETESAATFVSSFDSIYGHATETETARAFIASDDTEPVGMIVGTVTGPSRKVETVTGPAVRRVVTGPAVSREVTGPSLAAFAVDGPSRHVATLDGPNLSRLITGPDVARTLTGPGK